MLSLISVVFPVCVMRLESLSAEEGVTAGEKRGTAIRAFLKASSDTSRPPAGMRVHPHKHARAHFFYSGYTAPLVPPRPAHCHSNGSLETAGGGTRRTQDGVSHSAALCVCV